MSDAQVQVRREGGRLHITSARGTNSYSMDFLVAAMLIFIGKGSGRIEQQEADTMIELLEANCDLNGAAALSLLTAAISELSEEPTLGVALAGLARDLPDRRKEDLALMGLKVIAADGKREMAEMRQFNTAIEAAGIPADIVHRAYDRFFAETMPDTGD